MTETKVVEILNRDGQIERCNIEYDPAGAITIKCHWPGVLEKHEFSSRDFFEAVVLFREELERIGSRLLCMAARIDFFPSGMCRDMGRGLKGYVLRMGETTKRPLDIFDYAPPQLVGTVREQKEFHAKWLKSLARL